MISFGPLSPFDGVPSGSLGDWATDYQQHATQPAQQLAQQRQQAADPAGYAAYSATVAKAKADLAAMTTTVTYGKPGDPLPELEGQSFERAVQSVSQHEGMRAIIRATWSLGHFPFLVWMQKPVTAKDIIAAEVASGAVKTKKTGTTTTTTPTTAAMIRAGKKRVLGDDATPGIAMGAYWNQAAGTMTIKPVSKIEVVDFTNGPDLPIDAADIDTLNAFFNPILAKIIGIIPDKPNGLAAEINRGLLNVNHFDVASSPKTGFFPGLGRAGDLFHLNDPAPASDPQITYESGGIPIVTWANDSGTFGIYRRSVSGSAMWVIDRVYSIFEEYAYGHTYGVDVSSCDGVISSYTYTAKVTPDAVKEVPITRIEFGGDLMGYVQKAICDLKVDEAEKKAHRSACQKIKDAVSDVFSAIWGFIKDCWQAIKDAISWLADKICELVHSGAGAYVFAGIGCAAGALFGGVGCVAGAKAGVVAETLTSLACGSDAAGSAALAVNYIQSAPVDQTSMGLVAQPFPDGTIYRFNKKLGVYALYVPEQYASLRNLFTADYSAPVTLGDDAATPGPGHSDPPPTGTVWTTDVGAKPTGKQFTDGGTEDVPWYESPIVWVGIGVGAAAVTAGAVLLVRRKHAHDSVKK